MVGTPVNWNRNYRDIDNLEPLTRSYLQRDSGVRYRSKYDPSTIRQRLGGMSRDGATITIFINMKITRISSEWTCYIPECDPSDTREISPWRCVPTLIRVKSYIISGVKTNVCIPRISHCHSQQPVNLTLFLSYFHDCSPLTKIIHVQEIVTREKCNNMFKLIFEALWHDFLIYVSSWNSRNSNTQSQWWKTAFWDFWDIAPVKWETKDRFDAVENFPWFLMFHQQIKTLAYLSQK